MRIDATLPVRPTSPTSFSRLAAAEPLRHEGSPNLPNLPDLFRAHTYARDPSFSSCVLIKQVGQVGQVGRDRSANGFGCPNVPVSSGGLGHGLGLARRARVLLVWGRSRVIRSPICLLFSVPSLVPMECFGSAAGTYARTSSPASPAVGGSDRDPALTTSTSPLHPAGKTGARAKKCASGWRERADAGRRATGLTV